jgi:hypothetical protein
MKLTAERTYRQVSTALGIPTAEVYAIEQAALAKLRRLYPHLEVEDYISSETHDNEFMPIDWKSAGSQGYGDRDEEIYTHIQRDGRDTPLRSLEERAGEHTPAGLCAGDAFGGVGGELCDDTAFEYDIETLARVG